MERKLENIIILENGQELKYKPLSKPGGKPNYPRRSNKQKHAEKIKSQFVDAWQKAEASVNNLAVSVPTRDGVYLQIKGKAGYELLTKSLEDTRQGVRLQNVRNIEDVVCATVYVPNAKHDFFINKIKNYVEKEKKSPDVIDTVESINTAMVEALWLGNALSIPKEKLMWCEVWLTYSVKDVPKEVVEDFLLLCKSLEIKTKSQSITFPERIVVGVCADAKGLLQLLSSSSRIAEFRKMSPPTTFFTSLSKSEQREWSEDLAGRISKKEDLLISVCLLDTGVNNGHPILSELLTDNDLHTVKPSRGTDDVSNHGTRMAGIAGLFTLEDKLESTELIELSYILESVKILELGDANTPELYGDITAAGNTKDSEVREAKDYHTAIVNHSIEDPAQSWNAITVGAYTELSQLNVRDYEPLASNGGYSPFTSTSMTWDHKKWPIKPDIMMEGGNLAYSKGEDFYSEFEELSLLTTGNKYLTGEPFDTISMTSSAVAQASWLAANLWNRYPNLWPETIRAMLINSAEWTEEMKNSISSAIFTKADYRKLLRICGYGVPDLNRAIWSASNSVNMIIQDEIQPFIRKKSGSVTSNEMHIHELPWPQELLKLNENIDVRLKLTLSYFIEPGPGEVGWKDKYRYPSCGLSFDVNNPLEEKSDFVKRISVAMREDKNDAGSVKNDSSRWLLGMNNRNVGSVHSDIWEGTSTQLSESNMIAIYPKTGWWSTRTNLKKYNDKVRYALVVTIESPKTEIDLYTAIQTQIKSKAIVKTEITAL